MHRLRKLRSAGANADRELYDATGAEVEHDLIVLDDPDCGHFPANQSTERVARSFRLKGRLPLTFNRDWGDCARTIGPSKQNST